MIWDDGISRAAAYSCPMQREAHESALITTTQFSGEVSARTVGVRREMRPRHATQELT
jgi:hypothetical protein